MIPRTALFFALILMTLTILAACGPRHPLGIPDNQWQAMTKGVNDVTPDPKLTALAMLFSP
jgi:predicted small lipoprotein YifL